MRVDVLSWLGALLLLVLVVAGAGCSASTASDKSPDAAEAGVQAADPGGAAEASAAEVDAPEEETFTDRCHGVLSCTFFGFGMVIAAPFWVLGAVLGLVF